jgi:hypothetical protein
MSRPEASDKCLRQTADPLDQIQTDANESPRLSSEEIVDAGNPRT